MSNPYTIPLRSGRFYHIYNKGNNRVNLFYQQRNYEYFLRKYDEYLSDYVETFSFCLMPNHFHLLIRIRSFEEMESKNTIKDLPRMIKKAEEEKKDLATIIVTEQFRLFFMTYTKAINIQEGREGSLFRQRFKRKEINNLTYLQRVVYYIHRNPLHHGISEDFRNYPWSTYEKMLEERISKLRKTEVMEWFGGRENYKQFHNQKLFVSEELALET